MKLSTLGNLLIIASFTLWSLDEFGNYAWAQIDYFQAFTVFLMFMGVVMIGYSYWQKQPT